MYARLQHFQLARQITIEPLSKSKHDDDHDEQDEDEKKIIFSPMAVVHDPCQ